MAEILVKETDETNPAYGCDPQKRPIDEHIRNGIINLDKLSGPTSHQVSDWVKKIFCLKKAGHGGTLDPAVTGVLPVALENATKIIKLMLIGGKEYVALMHVHEDVDEKTVRLAMEKFIGKIKQLPPKRSSVKRVVREREIYEIEFLDMQKRDVLFRVRCQHGTYIRRLCEDFGKELGTGAHMIELRRTKAGGFSENDRLVTLQDLCDALAFWKEEGNEKFLRYCVQPLENALGKTPKVWIFDTTIESVCNGTKLAVPGISKLEDNIKPEDTVAVMSLKGELVGIGTAKMSSAEMMSAKNGIAVKLDRIVLRAGTYPAYKKE
ncbi:MAG: RNA-guided pseudouridylation complex pseudouridine synthase subunit Cbf5 [Candidatus Nanoarchaeia archaeon]|nr:RNA-guided pseudouridylation complex pseudouridine synthase subunit Cbf5 [Candidatus Nanoarchaeia archaeon]MDD5239642.1 RNA-guided pseudouridylation complex pseudouridine synthase subunit Cbf5 [Candidatus Nanoarchaeia archaeon]